MKLHELIPQFPLFAVYFKAVTNPNLSREVRHDAAMRAKGFLCCLMSLSKISADDYGEMCEQIRNRLDAEGQL
tara:strand:+ start:1152 stop:1370 length:219 start_codon:yes stop_codon:yes gene_type:complete